MGKVLQEVESMGGGGGGGSARVLDYIGVVGIPNETLHDQPVDSGVLSILDVSGHSCPWFLCTCNEMES